MTSELMGLLRSIGNRWKSWSLKNCKTNEENNKYVIICSLGRYN